MFYTMFLSNLVIVILVIFLNVNFSYIQKYEYIEINLQKVHKHRLLNDINTSNVTYIIDNIRGKEDLEKENQEENRLGAINNTKENNKKDIENYNILKKFFENKEKQNENNIKYVDDATELIENETDNNEEGVENETENNDLDLENIENDRSDIDIRMNATELIENETENNEEGIENETENNDLNLENIENNRSDIDIRMNATELIENETENNEEGIENETENNDLNLENIENNRSNIDIRIKPNKDDVEDNENKTKNIHDVLENKIEKNTFTKILNNKNFINALDDIPKEVLYLNKKKIEDLNNFPSINKKYSIGSTRGNENILSPKEVLIIPSLEQRNIENNFSKEKLKFNENIDNIFSNENKESLLRRKRKNQQKVKSTNFVISPVEQILDNVLLNEKNNSKENINPLTDHLDNIEKEETMDIDKFPKNYNEKKNSFNTLSSLLNLIKKYIFFNNINSPNNNILNSPLFIKKNPLEDKYGQLGRFNGQNKNFILDHLANNVGNHPKYTLRFSPKDFHNKLKKDVPDKKISKNTNTYQPKGVSKNSIINEKLLENLKKIYVDDEISIKPEEKKTLKNDQNKETYEKKNEVNSLKHIFKSVVKIYADVTLPDLEMLWQNTAPKHFTGSGFVIEGNLILTNAHIIAYSTRVLIRKHGSSKKYISKVIYVTHEADIAILIVQDSSFYEDIKSLELGSLPSLRDDVITVGYPSGGDKLSITKGIISRIDVQHYKHSNYMLLLTQIDAPMNPGNSGGPALVNGKVVGICFQSYVMANNISYIIPTIVIKHFLLDINKTNTYNGYAFLGIVFEPLENSYIRKVLGLENLEKKKIIKENQGILVTEIDTNQMTYKKSDIDYCNYIKSSTKENEENEKKIKKYKLNETIANNSNIKDNCYGLKKNDIILSIDRKHINNDGTTRLRNEESVGFQYLLNEKFIDDLCIVKIVRNKEVKDVVVKLSKINYLIPQHNWQERNKYFIYGGLVFTILSRNLYVGNESNNDEINRLINYNYFKKNEDDEIVLLKNILPSKLTIGYNYKDCIVLKVKNIIVRNLQHLVDLVENKNINKSQNNKLEENHYIKHSSTEHIQADENLIDFLILTPNGKEVPIIININDVKKFQSDIFKLYNIHNDRFLY